MKDSTYASRIERATAELQVAITTMQSLLGRLETLALQVAPDGPPTQGAPPLSPEQQTEIDTFIKRRLLEKDLDDEEVHRILND